MKQYYKRSTFRIIAVTIFASFITIILFMILFVGYGIVTPFGITHIEDDDRGHQGIFNVSDPSASLPQQTKSHEHAALTVFINGKLLNFSQLKYQNQDLQMHIENGDGFTIHKHAKKGWLGPFFESLNITFAQNCIIVDNEESYCSNFDDQITMLVNGKANNIFQHYVPKDGDRILLTYGNKDQINEQVQRLNSIQIRSN